VARAVFLDRDGIINDRRYPFLRTWSSFAFPPRALDALVRLAKTDYRILVATNQPWIDLGWLAPDTLDDIHRRMIAAVEDAGGRIDRVYHCTGARSASPCRKPNAGMLFAGAAEFGLDPEKCWMVGDQTRDVQAAQRFGARAILANPTLKARWTSRKERPYARAADLAEAVDIILAAEG